MPSRQDSTPPDEDRIERDAPEVIPGEAPTQEPIVVMIPVSKIWNWFKSRGT